MSRECPVSASPSFPGYLVIPPPPVVVAGAGDLAFGATVNLDTYAPFVPALAVDVVLTAPCLCLVMLSAYVVTTGTGTELVLDVAVTGATVKPAGSQPTRRLHVHTAAPQVVGLTMTMQAVVAANKGTTRVELMHAGAPGTIADVALTVVPLGLRP